MSDNKEFRNEKGQLHREDGPAVIYADGKKEYHINGERLSVEDFNKPVKEQRLYTSINEFKQYLESNSEDPIKLTVNLNSPYKWGQGWTSSAEIKTELDDAFVAMVYELGMEADLNDYGVVEGKGDKQIYYAYMHPMQLVFYLKEFDNDVSEKIKNAVNNALNDMPSKVATIDNITLKDADGEFRQLA